ncbi:MAG: YsnF/AvaK domain-containing protein [Bacteroidota bacterium]
MKRQNTIIVRDERGAEGHYETTEGANARVRLASGEVVHLPAERLHEQSGGYRFEGDFRNPASQPEPNSTITETIPIVEESLRARKEVQETGRVRISKRTETHTETIDEPLLRENVEVRRIPVDRVVDGPVEIRREGDVTIIPVMEERLVVQKQLVLKEELHVERRASTHHDPQHVDVRRERVTVQRQAVRESDSADEQTGSSDDSITKLRGDTT